MWFSGKSNPEGTNSEQYTGFRTHMILQGIEEWVGYS
jgi:hypothetical protein